MTSMTRSYAILAALAALTIHYTVAQSTLATVLGNRGDLDSFNELLDASGFSSGILRSAGFDGTVFAPNDDAFMAFPAPLYAALLDSEWSDHNVCFVSYHTVEGSFLVSQMPAELTTIDGDTLLVSGTNPTQVNGANIVVEDILASNGVAHILDGVLMPDCVTQNAYLQLSASADYSTLVSLLETAGLVDAIATTAPITIFAPPNQAWADMGERFVSSLEEPENLTFLRALLMNHVVSGNWYESRLDSDDSFTLQTLAGTTAFFFNESETNYITNSEIVETDTLASNGVIHAVNPVIILAAVADILQNAQVVSDTMSFSNFTAALKQANFFDALFLDDLNAPRTTTVFAPDDDAFAKVPNETIAKLLDPNWSFHLREFLRYHLADGTIPSDELAQLTTLPTLTNFSLTITSDRNLLMVDNATVIFPDLVAYNGVIHGIDSVLLPPSLTTSILEQVQANAQFSTFYSLLQASSNLTSLLQGDGPMTLFIPTNAAFELFDSTIDSSSFTPQDVERILQYHVVLQNVFLNEVANQTTFPTVYDDQVVTVSIVNDTTSSTTMDQQVTQYINQAQVLDGGLASNGVLYVLNEVLFPDLPTESPTSSPAPTFDGYIAPSSSPSISPAPVEEGGGLPSSPTSGTEPTTSGVESRYGGRIVLVVVAVCALLMV